MHAQETELSEDDYLRDDNGAANGFSHESSSLTKRGRGIPRFLQSLGRLAATAGLIMTLSGNAHPTFAQPSYAPHTSGQSDAPVLLEPADGTVLQGSGGKLRWQLPPGATQLHLQVTPANNDGPGINLIMNAGSEYTISQPVMGEGNYVMLRGMTYTWRVRTTNASYAVSEKDPSWGGWGERKFKTAPPDSRTITKIVPTVNDLERKRVCWEDADASNFYYDVQVSKDPDFGEGSKGAVAAVYANFVHGGMGDALNCWSLPADVEHFETYRVRVRQRVQGDGTPVPWSKVGTTTIYPHGGAGTTIEQYARERLPSEIAPVFANLVNDINSQTAVDEIADMSKPNQQVIAKRPDLVSSLFQPYAGGGLASAGAKILTRAGLDEIMDIDKDGVGNRRERMNGTASLDPFDYDPDNRSRKFFVITNGNTIGGVARGQENHIQANVLEFYHTLKRMGYTDDQIILFHQRGFPRASGGQVTRNVYPVVISIYNAQREGSLMQYGVKTENQVRELVLASGILDDPSSKTTIDKVMENWRSGFFGVSRNLLEGAQIDYENDRVTKRDYLDALRSLPIDGNDELYLINSGHDKPTGEYVINGIVGDTLTTAEVLTALPKQVGRIVAVDHSSYAGMRTDGYSSLNNFVGVASHWPDNSFGISGTLLYPGYLMEQNPYLSIGQLFSLVHDFPSPGFRPERQPYIREFGTSADGFFLYPRFR